MAVFLPQRAPILRPQHILPLPPIVRCSAVAPPKPHRATSIALDGVTSRPPGIHDPSLKSNWAHRAWLVGGCTTVLFSLAKSVAGALDSHVWFEPAAAALSGYVMADLGSGVYHWGIDNYGRAGTPLLGPQIEAFQGHHRWPCTITRRQFANNLHALGKAVAFTVLPITLLSDDPAWLAFVAVCSGCIMFSQQFHAWAHTTRSRLPAAVAALQDAGVLVSPVQHAAHHRAPYNNNYCIVSGVWNEVLDDSRFFEAMEMLIFFRFGVRPRSWTDPDPEWIEEFETMHLQQSS